MFYSNIKSSLISAYLMIILIILASVSSSATDVLSRHEQRSGTQPTVAPLFAGGDGSLGNPYQISNVTELQNMSSNLNAHYVLVNDIDASETSGWNWNGSVYNGFEPVAKDTNIAVGFQGTKFTGSLDGQGYNINDLHINRCSTDYVGLFGSIGSSSMVSNVSMLDNKQSGKYYVGGLVGYQFISGTVSNSYTTGNVSGEYYVGGLVGQNGGGTVNNSYTTGNVSGEYYVGGLVGYLGFICTVNNTYTTGNVSGDWYVGGLVGYRGNSGPLSNSYATGNVSGDYYVGGLLGYNLRDTVSNSYATGAVSGNFDIGGGLVGRNEGIVTNSFAINDVTGINDRVGGLVGQNWGGTVEKSYATGNVSGNDKVGGLVGDNGNNGIVSNSYAIGYVNGSIQIGGLLGFNYDATVSNSYATGSVSGYLYIGGLVGDNYGTVSNSYATGNATCPSSWSNYIGGFVGENRDDAIISNSYATGNVSGAMDNVGGFVGKNSNTGEIENCYSTGVVTGNVFAGGFCGDNTGDITHCFFDKQTSGLTTSDGGTSRTTSQMKTKTTFALASWDFIDIWGIIEKCSYPFLQNFNYSISIGDIVGLNKKDAIEDEPYMTDYDIEIIETDLPGITISVNDTSGFLSLDTNASFLSINETGVLNGTPRNDDVGIYFINISVKISEFDLSKYTNFTLTVHNTNDVPYILSLPPLTASEGVMYTYSVVAGDDDLNISVGENLTYKLDFAPNGMNINYSKGLIQWMPTNEQACQNHTVIVNVTDIAETFDTQEFTINVINSNDPPMITNFTITTAVEDEKYDYQITAIDDDLQNPSIEQLTFLLDTAPTGMTVEIDGLIQWLPTNDDVGIHWVNVTVSDLAQTSDSHSYTLTVINVNDAPVIKSEPVLKVTAWDPYEYQLNVIDVDLGDILTYSLDTSPENMVINETSGLITWIAEPEQIGDNPVIVRVSDGNESDTQEFNIKVTAPANYAPRATLIFPTNGSLVNVTNPILTWSSEDPDSEMIIYDVYLHSYQSKVRTLDPISRLGAGQRSESYLTTSLTKGSMYYWTVIPDDGEATGKCSSGIWWFKVSDNAEFNIAPVIISEPIKSATVGEQYRYEVLAEDDNLDDILEFSLVEHPTNMAIDAGLGIILWTPNKDQLGKHTVTVEVTDNRLIGIQTFEIEVTMRNNKPEITTIPEQTFIVGEKFSFQVIASDVDIGDVLIYQLENAPARMMINSTGMITWVPNKDQVGKHTISLNVSDGKDYTSIEFTVNIKKEDTTSSDSGSALQASIIIIIIVIIVLIALTMIMMKRKKVQKDKLVPPGIPNQEVQQPEMIISPYAPQTTQTTMLTDESMISGTQVQDTSQLGAAPFPEMIDNQLLQTPQVQPTQQLLSATATEPEPMQISQTEIPPENVTHVVEALSIQKSQEIQSTEELTHNMYVQPEPQLLPQVQETQSSITPTIGPTQQTQQEQTLTEETQSIPQNLCSTCNQPLTFYSQNNKYYCHQCQRYE